MSNGVRNPSPEEGRAAHDAVFSEVKEEMDKAGITPAFLVGKLQAELDAEQVRVFHYQGKITISKPLVDWQTRQKARQDAHELLSHYPPKRLKVNGVVQVLKPDSVDIPPTAGLEKNASD